MILPQPFNELATWSLPAAAAGGGLALGILIRRTILPWIARAAAKSVWKYDDVLVEAIRGPILLWCVLIGLRLAVKLLPLSGETDETLGTIVLVLGIFSVTWAVARFAAGALRTSATAGTLPGVSLLANMTRAAVFTVGILIILQTLGISIGPLVATLGIGGLAVGLALQDTLANFFAGLRILAARKIRPGDLIRLESGQEGYVEDITWGLTTIRQPANNIVIVPNAKLGAAITTNFNLPDLPQGLNLTLGVGFGSDLDRVEQVTLDVARTLQQESPAAVKEFEPVVRYQGFGEFSITFLVVLRARTWDDRGLLQHEFIKRLHARYAAEGIEIPFPTRTIRKLGGGDNA